MRSISRRSARWSSARTRTECVGCYRGTEQLVHYIEVGRQEEKAKSGGQRTVDSPDELRRVQASNTSARNSFRQRFQPGETVDAIHRRRRRIDIDQGRAAVDENGDMLCKAYQLSNGNPIEDTIDMFEPARHRWRSRARGSKCSASERPATPKIFCKDMLKADVALVETVAHTESAMKFYRRSARDRRRGRAGHQDHHPERWAREGFQAEHAMLGGQRILSAIDRGRIRHQSRAIRGHWLSRPKRCRCSDTAARCSCNRTS